MAGPLYSIGLPRTDSRTTLAIAETASPLTPADRAAAARPAPAAGVDGGD